MEKERTHKIIGVRVTESMAKELELLAKDQQRSVSNVIRMALDEYLNKYFGEQK